MGLGKRKYLLAGSIFTLVAACMRISSGAGVGPSRLVGDQPLPTTDKRCATIKPSGQLYSYCVSDTTGRLTSGFLGPRLNILYFWHGVAGTSEEVFDSLATSTIADHLKNKAPVMIGLSIGPTGVVGPQAGEITDRVLPEIEAKLASPQTQIRRIMMGLSMGAQNTLRVVGEKPDLFQAAAGLCPALIGFDPFNSTQVLDYFRRNKGTVDIGRFLAVLEIFKLHFSSKKNWDKNNPFTFLHEGRYDHVDLFLSIGRQDDFGFYEGVNLFQKEDPRGPNPMLTVSYVEGHHCSFDADSLAGFIARNFGLY